MARGDLLSKLIASYGKDDEFRAVAEKIIAEEEQKNNNTLAKTLRKSLMVMGAKSSFKSFNTFMPTPSNVNEYLHLVNESIPHNNLVMSLQNREILDLLKNEFRKSNDIKLRGLPLSNKILFCGPPGSGKTLSAKVFANEVGLPLYVLKLDALISSYLGETASNIRKVFEFAQHTPCVLFLDEFDSLARSREDNLEHNELRRVVNSLLLFIEQLQPKGFLIAATNLDNALDSAIWRRFDEVLWFGLPDLKSIEFYLNKKFKNLIIHIDLKAFAKDLKGLSYAEIERVCNQSIKHAVLDGREGLEDFDFIKSMENEKRRKSGLKS